MKVVHYNDSAYYDAKLSVAHAAELREEGVAATNVHEKSAPARFRLRSAYRCRPCSDNPLRVATLNSDRVPLVGTLGILLVGALAPLRQAEGGASSRCGLCRQHSREFNAKEKNRIQNTKHGL